MSPSSILSRRLVGKPIDSRRLLPDVPRYEDGVANLGPSVVSAQPLLDNSPTGYANTDYPSDSYPSGSDFYSANPTRHVWDEQNPLAANRSSTNPLDRGISIDSGTASPTSSGNITAADTPKAVTDYQEYAQHPELHGGDPKSSFWRRLGGALIDTAGTWGQGFGVPRGITHHLAQDVRYGPDAAHAKENYWQNYPLMRDAANMAEKQQEIGLRQRQLDESAKYRAAMMQANADRYAQMERDKTETAALNEGGRPIPTGPTMQQSLGSFDTPAITDVGPREGQEDVQDLPSRRTSLIQQPLTQNMTPEDMARRTIPAGPGGPAYQMAIPPKTANWPTISEDMAQQLDDLGIKGFQANEQLDPRSFAALQSTLRQQLKGPKQPSNVTELEQIANDPAQPPERRAIARASLDDELRRAIAGRPPGPDRVGERADRSYNTSVSELDKIEKENAVYSTNAKLAKFEIELNQHTPQADSMLAPGLLSFMVGGQGSGLRMNEAEISRVVGGRSNWESLKAAIKKWDPNNADANSITESQRSQIRAMYVAAKKVASRQQAVMDQGYDALNKANSPEEHRNIVTRTRKALGESYAVDDASVQQQLDQIFKPKQ